jgi:hypothetical protein
MAEQIGKSFEISSEKQMQAQYKDQRASQKFVKALKSEDRNSIASSCTGVLVVFQNLKSLLFVKAEESLIKMSFLSPLREGGRVSDALNSLASG